MKKNIFNLNNDKIVKKITDALHQADGGELFIERCEAETLTIENGILRHSDFNSRSGFGLRSFKDEQTIFHHSSDISEQSISEAVTMIKNNHHSNDNKFSYNHTKINSSSLYPKINPIEEINFEDKLLLIKTIDNYLQAKKLELKQSIVTLSGQTQSVQIIKKDGEILYDTRPLVRLNILVILEKNGKTEQGYCGIGGRNSYKKYCEQWQNLADEAIRQAQVNLESIPAPAGEMTVVLGNGWPGILLHEAIGHGLEGDFNRKKTSGFSELIGKKVAHEEITVVDDGTVKNARGSINIDDEGTKSQRNTLIENGILKNYMHDCMNAKLMKKNSTGSGRRESYAHPVLPRMTNTYMLAGKNNPKEIIASVDQGIYAVNFGGGQVDITSGKFVFLASEAYMIEKGKVTNPVKGATLIGNGPDVLTKISMVGDDLKLDPGVGTCSKNGQNIPVGVGQPTVKIDSIVVGGTKTN
ncbi:MAG: metalloprotease TldD [Rickettsiaceae bacterium H1]|nr:metalloprotease TldD [Rickettsiaceae bacterium H1]